MTPTKPSSLGQQPAGAAPLDGDSLDGLRLSWVTTQGELNEAEAANILSARGWAYRRRAARLWVLDPDALREIHRRMLADVWTWAGTFRLRETTIGIDPYQIPVATRDLCDDIKAQLGDGIRTAYPLDEIAGRFHHRLVQIHLFPNGNGRHARLATDLLVRDLGLPPFTWGGTVDDMVTATDARSAYITALRAADGGEIAPLLAFVRSEDGNGAPYDRFGVRPRTSRGPRRSSRPVTPPTRTDRGTRV